MSWEVLHPVLLALYGLIVLGFGIWAARLWQQGSAGREKAVIVLSILLMHALLIVLIRILIGEWLI